MTSLKNGVLEPATSSAPVDVLRPIAKQLGKFLRQPSLVLASVTVVIVLSWAAAPSLFTSFDPIVGDTSNILQPPSAEHLFGTDNLGRDVFGRVVYGSAESLRATTLAVLIGLVVGSVIGLIAGAASTVVDDVLMRITDVLLAIPALLLSLMVVTALGFGTTNVAIAVGITAVATFARVMRAEVLRVRSQPYVEAAAGLGLRRPVVLLRHVLPNSAGPVLTLAAVEFGNAVLAVAALSFLGYGNPPPSPEWGAIISSGRAYLGSAWWITTLPGIVVVLVVVAANRISRGIEQTRRARG